MNNLYSLYHLNTNFSSINPSKLKTLINNSYSKLLDMIENNNFNIAIEASGKSLIDIFKINEKFIKRLRHLIDTKKCSFVGSGYMQIIMPLSPYELNEKNLFYGNEIYKKLLGFKPEILYVNEQSFSKSLIPLFKKYKYKKIILEYNNTNSSVKKKFTDAYSIDSIKDDYNNKIDVIWNDHILFQKFQRYVSNEISENEYLSFLKKKQFRKNQYLPLYCSDIEGFGFSPGRYKTETKDINNHWRKIEDLYKKLILKGFNHKNIYKLKTKLKRKSYDVTSICNPIIVKKQLKYNLTRWCLTGRNDLKINTFCWRIYSKLTKSNKSNKKRWLELCELWSSDFRTHVTESKWKKLIKKFRYKKLIKLDDTGEIMSKSYKYKKNVKNQNILLKDKNYLLNLDGKKGFSINDYRNIKISNKKIFGCLSQGFFESNKEDVDFFSGHSILELGTKKLTDINDKYENYYLSFLKPNFKLSVLNGMENHLTNREISISKQGDLVLINRFKNIPNSSLRTFYLTINPKFLNKRHLFLQTHNGGNKAETFRFETDEFNYGKRVSNIVSSTTCLGSTKNSLIIGDNNKQIKIKLFRNISAIMPMLEYRIINKSYLLRVFFSCCETDDTSKEKKIDFVSKIQISLKVT